MRSLVFGVCLLASACSAHAPSSPLSPTTDTESSLAPAQTSARGATSLPFSGSYTGGSHATFQPPITLVLEGAGSGTAAHVGGFTLTQIDFVDSTQSKSTGTFTLVAANGDELRADTAGGEDAFTPPNVSHTTLLATIVGGTGRFARATGSFTILNTQVIDFATATATYDGSFEGRLDLNN